jgi:cytochrome d ubiquinol oxidase subunit II
LLTAFYAPLIAMLLALVFRGVAFEFRFKDRKHKPLWDLAFAGGSTAATFFQGVALGAFIQGIEIEGRSYAGGWFDWLTPFSLFTGLALVLGYALLGAGWLVIKTTGALQQRVYVIMRPLALATLTAIAAVSLWTPLLNEEIAERWFSWPNIVYLSPVPLLVAVGAAGLYRAIQLKLQIQPFVLTLGLFLLSYLGLGISLYPNIIPPEVSLWVAAAPDESLAFLLVGTLVLLPLILAYTAYSYWVFRGKVKLDDGHD